MRVACVGGGPGGLYLAILLRLADPANEVTVYERNAADDTFGFGVVFSDETLDAFAAADPASFAAITDAFVRWGDIDTHLRGQVYRSGGHGFAALSRQRLLTILQRRATELGATIHFGTQAPGVEELRARYDLVVGADGVHSVVRAAYPDTFRPSLDTRRCRYIWLGTDKPLAAFTFAILDTGHGPAQVHAYPYGPAESTVIVELHEDVWRAAGLDTDGDPIARCEELLSDLLDGHRLIGNNSRWIRFGTVRTATWRHRNVVLLGDAAHTAHFSIGSGTKLAMEDAIALAGALARHSDVDTAVKVYEEERRPVVESTQRAAQGSLEWFEGIGRYLGQAPEQFVFGLLTRSRRITYENLRLRDPGFTDRIDRWFAGANGLAEPRPPMFTPFRVRGLELANRVVVSPMDMYVSEDGLIGDFHLVHLGARALGGAGLVMTEMACVSAEGRITPGCAGLYRDEHAAAWHRLVDFVHAQSEAKIGIQLGHSGRKGSTKLMWEGMDEPLDDGNWPLLAPSPLPYGPAHQVPRAMDQADLDRVRTEFVTAAERARTAGFDLLELHMAHGYLLSSFLTPLSNRRTDSYGGSLANRARYPLDVLDAVRGVWPGPLSVRISATDWVDGGFDGDDAVAFARMLAEHGADLVDVSTGQTSPDARPAYGRSYQTPFSDRIRNEVGIPTIAVGAISSADDVNSIILAGRADLCALARPHLYDPAWTLHAAAELGYSGPGVHWPLPYRAGSRRPPTGKR
jgi:anthraniloyl-CoA monooxygenase